MSTGEAVYIPDAVLPLRRRGFLEECYFTFCYSPVRDAQGRVQGDVKARRINVEGTVNGDLYALEGVTLRQGALVTGNVFANKISIAEGARLNGRVDMDKAPTVPNVPKLKAGETAAEGSAALPDLSDVQVIVQTTYSEQAPRIVEDQVTYPIAAEMLKVPGARTVRGYSFFGVCCRLGGNGHRL